MRFNKKKRGYTIVEAIISIAITLIILPVVINMLLNTVSEFRKYIEYSIELNNLDSGILNIDELLRANEIISIQASNEEIFIMTQKDLDKKFKTRKDIYLERNTLFVETLNNHRNGIIFYQIANNVLIRDVKEFEVVKKGNLIYYSIEMKSGLKRVRCI